MCQAPNNPAAIVFRKDNFVNKTVSMCANETKSESAWKRTYCLGSKPRVIYSQF